MNASIAAWREFLAGCRDQASGSSPFQWSGRLTRINGLVMEASGLKLPLGSGCRIQIPGDGTVEAEVVGFSGEKLYMMPTEDVYGLAPGAHVVPLEIPPPRARLGHLSELRRRSFDRAKHLPVGDQLLGRVVDGNGRPLDSLGTLDTKLARSLVSRPLNPLQRAPIDRSLDVGIRAINALLTVGRGQRLGLFAGSGVGKSVLLGMMARYTAADVSPLMRLQGAAYATTVAEEFRDQGRHVLLIMDSLTRYAMAQREIALAVGEPPVTRGYPPSVFARLPQLVERAGNGAVGGGSITAFYTVLAEGDDQQDPIADAARAILDGHIVLTRHLADAGHYPAIDIEQSISRAMTNLIEPSHLELVRTFKQLYSRYQRARDLLAVGAYAKGSDQLLDQAIALYPQLERFLQQEITERADYGGSLAALRAILGTPA